MVLRELMRSQLNWVLADAQILRVGVLDGRIPPVSYLLLDVIVSPHDLIARHWLV